MKREYDFSNAVRGKFYRAVQIFKFLNSSQTKSMHFLFYLRKGIAYVPTTARTEAGYWLGMEPIDVEPVADAEALRIVLLRAVGRGNPVVPTPSREIFPNDAMRRYCGMKSFSAFERTAQLWSISRYADSYSIYPWRRSERYRGGWEEGTEPKTVIPASTSLEEVVRVAANLAFEAPS